MENQSINQPEGNIVFNDSPIEQPKKRRLWLKILLGIVITIILLVVIFISTPYVLQVFSEDISTVNDADLRFMPKIVPDSENIYSDLKLLDGKVINQIGNKNISDYLRNGQWDQAAVDQTLAVNSEAIGIFDRMIQKPKFSDPQVNENANFSDIISLQSSKIRDISYVILLQAENLAKQGKNSEALSRVFEVADMGQKLEEGNSNVIETLIGIAVKGLALEEIKKISSADPMSLAQYQGKLESYNMNGKFLKNVVKLEYTGMANGFDYFATGVIDEVKKQNPNFNYKSVVYLQPNKTKQLFADGTRKDIASLDENCDFINNKKIEEPKKYSESMVVLKSLRSFFTPNAIGEILYEVAHVDMSTSLYKKVCEQNAQISGIQKGTTGK